MQEGTNIRDALSSMLAGIEQRDPQVVMSAKVFKAWKMSATEAQQAHVNAVYLVPETQGSKVVVYVDSSIWATELGLQSEILRLKMNLALRELNADGLVSGFGDLVEPVKQLRFKVSKEEYRSRVSADIPVQTQLDDEDMRIDAVPVPLTAEEERSVREQVARIENPAVRDAAYNAMKTDLELKKGMRG